MELRIMPRIKDLAPHFPQICPEKVTWISATVVEDLNLLWKIQL
jgi:hypothetical protein